MTDATPTAEDIIAVMTARFKSCNGIPVERAHLKREEWDALVDALTRPAPRPEGDEWQCPDYGEHICKNGIRRPYAALLCSLCLETTT